MWIWSRIFTTILTTGEKIAVMLIDTQGIFDGNTTMKENVLLFSLSTLLSSVQIYNLQNQIQENDLQNLQLFTEYGKALTNKNSQKAFQTLLFLIRDWPNKNEYGFGVDGGKKYLEKIMSVPPIQREELRNIRTYLKSGYEHLDCFLLPNPGEHVARSDEFKFTGELGKIDKEFKKFLKELVPKYLAPDNVVLKKICGENVRAEQLPTYAETFVNYLNSGNVSPKTIFEATLEANNLIATSCVIEYYNNEMLKKIKEDEDFITYEKMLELHENIFQGAIELFNSKTNFGNEQLRSINENKLTKDINKQLLLFLSLNENKRTKVEEILKEVQNELKQFRAETAEQKKLIEDLQIQLIGRKNEIKSIEREHRIQMERESRKNKNFVIQTVGTAVLGTVGTVAAGAGLIVAAPLVVGAGAIAGLGSILWWTIGKKLNNNNNKIQ